MALASEAAAEPGLVAFAYDNDIPLVATNDAYFADAAMYEAARRPALHRRRALSAQADRRRVTAEHWFKPQEEMRRLFADLPEAFDNTIEIARRCAFMVAKRDPILPRFPTTGGRNEAEEMAYQAREGLRAGSPRSRPRRWSWRPRRTPTGSGWSVRSASSARWAFRATS